MGEGVRDLAFGGFKRLTACTGTTSQKLVKNITIPIWSMHLSINNN
jgi:hypothetical protein